MIDTHTHTYIYKIKNIVEEDEDEKGIFIINIWMQTLIICVAL